MQSSLLRAISRMSLRSWLGLRRVLVGVFVLAACSSDDSSGSSGVGGTAGSAGSAGASGAAGSAGVAGSAGASGASGASGAGGSGIAVGEPHEGEYQLGPVEWTGSFWNSCGPYPAEIEAIEGGMLAGVGLDFNGHGELCDTCIQVTADNGKTIVARVITTGETTAPNNIDLSQAAFDAVTTGEYPRLMSWQVVGCPDTGPMRYQFQTGANTYWTSFWVRNPRYPIASVEVKSANHPDFTALARGDDGTYTDASGFGDGAFTLRITSTQGAVVTDDFPSFNPGDLLTSASQFP